MNETRVFADGYRGVFQKQEDFLECLKSIGRNSFWERRNSKNLRLVAITSGSKVEEELKEKYADEGLDEDIITDTIINTGLLLKVRNQYYPVRSCAIKSILDRAGISGAGLRRVEKSVYARILNDCLKVAKGEALLRISEGKVSAVLGGDCHDYAVLDMEQVFLHSVDYLTGNFKGCSYYDKLGIQAVMDEEEDNWVAKEVGHRLEDLVAEIFSRQTGLKVYPVRKMFRHPLCPFMLADVDFFIDFPDGSKGMLDGMPVTAYNDLALLFDNEGIEKVSGSLFSVKDTGLEGTILSPDEAVWKLQEQAAFLNFEGAGRVSASEITLEYVVVISADGKILVTPVWRFLLGEDGDERNFQRQKILGVDAVTGELIWEERGNTL